MPSHKRLHFRQTVTPVIFAPTIKPPKSKQRALLSPSIDRIALLVGCEYTAYERADRMERLPGCHADIIFAEKMLREHYNYSNITVLMDDGLHTMPTRAAILTALYNVMQTCRDTPSIKTLVIYFSGHGTQIVDAKCEEDDGKDECFVPCDFMENGMLTDITLHSELWTNLPSTLDRVTCVADCCNSGTLYNLPYTYEPPNTTRNVDNKHPTNSNMPLIVTISGCQDTQTSASAYNLERNVNWEGAMSFCLRSTLRNDRYSNTTPLNQLVDNLRTELKRRSFSQFPQIALNRPILLSRITRLF